MSQIEVLPMTDTGRRRRWSDAEKLRIVEESYASLGLAAAVARRYEISRSLLTRWRREARAGLLVADQDRTPFTPVAVERPVSADQGHDGRVDHVEVVLSNGRRLVVSASIEAGVLARLIQVVERA